jgi:hypothetical protein
MVGSDIKLWFIPNKMKSQDTKSFPLRSENYRAWKMINTIRKEYKTPCQQEKP